MTPQEYSFRHGMAKLQSGSSSQLCLTSNDGGQILIQSATTADFMPIPLSPGGINQECFNNTACVKGETNKSLVANTLYSVYIKNLNGTAGNNRLEFWPTLEGFNPTLQGNGLYVANTGGPNIGLMYVGQLWTGNSNISTVIGPEPNMYQPCYSHFNPWTFGFQTTEVIYDKMQPNQSGLQNSPSILTVTEGISESPEFVGNIVFYSSIPGTFIQFYINVSGQSIDGPWSVNSPIQYASGLAANQFVSMTAHWMSAPPIGVYTAKLYINVNNPTYIKSTLLGKLSL